MNSFHVVPSFCVRINRAPFTISDLAIPNHLKWVVVSVELPGSRRLYLAIFDGLAKRWQQREETYIFVE
jgi:hypothetical protein